MGEKGVKSGQEAADMCERAVEALAPVGDLSSRKMFGGYGIFESGAMFALVNSQGELFFKADDSNRTRFEEAGARQHGKMPYFEISSELLADTQALRDWAKLSIQVAHASKKK